MRTGAVSNATAWIEEPLDDIPGANQEAAEKLSSGGRAGF